MQFESMLQAFKHTELGNWLKEADVKPARAKAARIEQLVELYPTPRAQKAMLAAKCSVSDLHGVMQYFQCYAGSTDPNKLIDMLFKLPYR